MLEFINLNNYLYMYDTYTVIINKLKDIVMDKNNYTKAQFGKYFTIMQYIIPYMSRAIYKGVIMTINYGIGLRQAIKDFNVVILSKPRCFFSSNFSDNSKIVQYLIISFPLIYYFLKKGLVNDIFYKHNIVDVMTKILEIGGMDLVGNINGVDRGISVDDLTMFIRYYTLKQRQVDIRITTTVNNISTTTRFTMGNQDRKLNENEQPEIDFKKTVTACFVNVVHMLDSLYLRRVVKLLKERYDISIFTMHDSYAIEFTQVNTLLLVAGDAIQVNTDLGILPTENKNIKVDKFYSIVV